MFTKPDIFTNSVDPDETADNYRDNLHEVSKPVFSEK